MYIYIYTHLVIYIYIYICMHVGNFKYIKVVNYMVSPSFASKVVPVSHVGLAPPDVSGRDGPKSQDGGLRAGCDLPQLVDDQNI